jgi:hypothetical protein
MDERKPRDEKVGQTNEEDIVDAPRNEEEEFEDIEETDESEEEDLED